MNLSVFFLTLCCLQTAMAGSIWAQEISMKEKNTPLTQVLNKIEQQTSYTFFYKKKDVEGIGPLNFSVEHADIQETLDKLFEQLPCTYEIQDQIIVLKRKLPGASLSNQPSLQDRRISGTVKDSTGTPIPGVSVLIRSTSKGTSTDVNGAFQLQVKPGDVLLFRSVGYTDQTVAIDRQTALNIVLHAEAASLGEVVVIGYGTQKKADITGAVASYNAADIENRPVARLDQALVGQMAGVQVRQTTGVPGKAFSIQVRGSGSISAGNEPLYVIDGFPLTPASPNNSGSFSTGNPLDNINPNDIESIQVLKDAASAAIYGSRAANGVVLITTKQGKTGKAQISFNTYAGYNEASRKLGLLNAEQWIDRATEMINAQWVASGPGRTANQTTEERREVLGLAPGLVNTDLMLDDRWAEPGHPGLYFIDWQDKAFRKGFLQNHQLSASGANEYVKYYASANYSDQQGIVMNLDYKSYAARANIEVNAFKKVKFGFNLAPSYSIGNDPGVEGQSNFIHRIVSIAPVQEDRAEDVNVFDHGSYKWLSATTQLNSPITRSDYTIGQTKRFRMISSLFGAYEITDGLTLKTTLNLDNTDNNYKNYIPYTVSGTLSNRESQPGLATTSTYNSYRHQTFLNENTLSYAKVFNSVHDFSALAGFSYNSDKLESVNLNSVGGFGSPVITTLNAAAAIAGGTTETRNVLLSYFGRVQYAYDQKYLLSASLRRDGSSRFGANSKYGWFPSASVGWRISSEPFMKNITVINDFKVRASWGKSGNYNIGDYSSIPLLGTNNYSFNGGQAYGQAPIGLINPNLSWETSKTTDVGFDLSILNNRITTAFDYYTKLNVDLLLNVPLPANTGFSSYLDNAGKVRNKGWELEISSRNLTGQFQWNTSLNISHNTNKVVELSGGQEQIYIPSRYDIPHSILKVGEPLYAINVVRQIGILTQADIDNHAALYGSETVGDPKYLDANNDGVIDANDRVIVGHPTPDYTWGITNTFRYKGFDLSVLIQGQQGGSIYSLLGRSLNRTGMVFADNTLASYNERWRSPEDPGAGLVGKAYSTFGRIKNTDWLYSSDYFRVRNITMGYDLKSIIKSDVFKAARVYVTAENFFGKDKYTGGYNPQANNTDLSGSSLYPEAGDYGGLPIPKSMIIGVNVSF